MGFVASAALSAPLANKTICGSATMWVQFLNQLAGSAAEYTAPAAMQVFEVREDRDLLRYGSRVSIVLGRDFLSNWTLTSGAGSYLIECVQHTCQVVP